ncbi:MAG: hypothetical protein PHY47_25165 [Lachnospiraceae bacterium]|nr:hypothetical protein [Lachnospiraceae bacterium]
MRINVLGTEYTIEFRNYEEDELMKKNEVDGYCDKSIHLIVVANKTNDCEVDNFEEIQKSIIRHELIHAFMYESGLSASWEHQTKWGHDETTVDWIACQFPKLMKAFEDAKCL